MDLEKIVLAEATKKTPKAQISKGLVSDKSL
jgi:hypothetical protein